MKKFFELVRALLLRHFGYLYASWGAQVQQVWHVECWMHFHKDGSRCTTPHDQCPLPHPVSRLRWAESFVNLVPTVGLNKYLDATLKTGLASPAWYVGLVDNAGFTAYAAGDTMASHTGWAESTVYSNATRPAFTPGTISGGSVDNSASKAVFNINGSATIRGSFMCDNSTKGGTTGTLQGEGDYTGGSKGVSSGDTLNVTVTCSITST